jgi:hypothetical protein
MMLSFMQKMGIKVSSILWLPNDSLTGWFPNVTAPYTISRIWFPVLSENAPPDSVTSELNFNSFNFVCSLMKPCIGCQKKMA